MEHHKMKSLFSCEDLFQTSIQPVDLCCKCLEVGFIDALMHWVDLLQRGQNGAGLDLYQRRRQPDMRVVATMIVEIAGMLVLAALMMVFILLVMPLRIIKKVVGGHGKLFNALIRMDELHFRIGRGDFFSQALSKGGPTAK